MNIKGDLQKRFIGWLIKDLYNTISADDLLKEVDGEIKYKGETLDPDTVNSIKADMNMIKGSLGWEILSNEAKYVSNLKI